MVETAPFPELVVETKNQMVSIQDMLWMEISNHIKDQKLELSTK